MAKMKKPDESGGCSFDEEEEDVDASEAAELVLYQVSECYVYLVINYYM